MSCVHLLISGRVQGVFYRASTQQAARKLGLSGWVRNLPDGRVEAMVQGAKTEVDRLVKWCHSGPTHARVATVVVEVVDDGRFDAFSVRY
jgi:acylphosphatase